MLHSFVELKEGDWVLQNGALYSFRYDSIMSIYTPIP